MEVFNVALLFGVIQKCYLKYFSTNIVFLVLFLILFCCLRFKKFYQHYLSIGVGFFP